jgi:hypothetical protein
VDRTRWPVSAAAREVLRVSESRISPTRMTSGVLDRHDVDGVVGVDVVDHGHLQVRSDPLAATSASSQVIMLVTAGSPSPGRVPHAGTP